MRAQFQWFRSLVAGLKRFKRIPAFMLVAGLVIVVGSLTISSTPPQAWADESTTTNSEVRDGWEPKVDIDYSEVDGKHIATVTLTNDFVVAMRDIKLNAFLPAGLVTNEETKLTAPELKVGESASFNFEFAEGEPGSNVAQAAAPDDYFTRTGFDFAPYAVGGAVILLAGGAALVLVFSRRKRNTTVTASIAGALTIALVVGTFPSQFAFSEAEDLHAEKTVTETVTLDNKEYSIKAVANINSFDIPEASSIVRLNAREQSALDSESNEEKEIAEGANFGSVIIVSPQELASVVTADKVSFRGALASASVKGVERLSDTELRISYEGALVTGEPVAYIGLAQGAFVDSSAVGSVSVQVAKAEGTIIEHAQTVDTNAAEKGADAIPVDLGSAQLGPDVSVKPADGNSAITYTVQGTEGDHGLIATAHVAGNDPQKNAEMLSESLAKGIQVEGTNVGTVVAHPSEAKEEATTASVAPVEVKVTDFQTFKSGADKIRVVYDAELSSTGSAGDNNGTRNIPADTQMVLQDPSDGNSITVPLATANGKNPTFSSELTVGSAETAALVQGGKIKESFKDLPDGAQLTVQGRGVNNLFSSLNTYKALAAAKQEDEPAEIDVKVVDSGTPDVASGFAAASSVLGVLARTIDIFTRTNPLEVVASGTGAFSAVFGLFAEFFPEDRSVTLATLDKKIDRIGQTTDEIKTDLQVLTEIVKKQEKTFNYTISIPELYTQVSKLQRLQDQLAVNFESIVKAFEINGYSSFDEIDEFLKQSIDEAIGTWQGSVTLSNESIPAITEKLANLLASNSTLSKSGVVRDYIDFLDAQYNWDIETVLPLKNFLAASLGAFNAGYFASQAILAREYEKATNEQDRKRYAANKVLLAQLAHDVNQSVLEDPVVKARLDVSGTKLKNLVTGQTFDLKKDFGNHFSNKRPDAVWLPSSKDPDDVETFSGVTSPISEAQFKEMWGRLANVRRINEYKEVTSIAAELEKLGATLYRNKKSDLGHVKDKYWKIDLHYENSDWYLVSDIFRENYYDSASYWHERHFVGTCFNIRTGEVSRRAVYTAYTYYPWKVPARWWFKTWLSAVNMI